MALWLLLALPGAAMLFQLAKGHALAMDLLHPSGEMAVRLMVLAMLPGPLAAAFGAGRVLRGWLAIRRNLGVAAFGYALLHLALYLIDMGALAAVLDELGLPAIWTGWLALALLAVPAAISSTPAQRALGRAWPALQRLVYPALILTLLHWLLLDWHWQGAAFHLFPLLVAWTARFAARQRTPRSQTRCVSPTP